jgi:hypothetical protein
MDLEDRERTLGVAAGQRPVASGHGDDPGQAVIAGAGEPRRHPGAVGDPHGGHAPGVEAAAGERTVDEDVEEDHVPVPLSRSDAPERAAGIGVDDGEPLAIRQARQAGVALHERSVAVRAMQRDDHRHRAAARARDVDESRARRLPGDGDGRTGGPPGADRTGAGGVDRRARRRCRRDAAGTGDDDRHERGERGDEQREPP